VLGIRPGARRDECRSQLLVTVAVDGGHQNTQLCSNFHQARDRSDDRARSLDEPAQQRPPRKVNGDFVGETRELAWHALDALDEERGVLQARSLGPPGPVRKGIRARVEGDREGRRLGPRAMQDVAAVARTDVHEDVAERSGC